MLIEAMLTWAVSSAASVPMGSAENIGVRAIDAGQVVPGADARATLAALLVALRADAARRSGVDAARLTVVSTVSTTWPDGALGCPMPGRMYTQALVPGWQVRIDAAGQALSYHTSTRGQWLLCPSVRNLLPTPGTSSQ
jgi:hypothetical protein